MGVKTVCISYCPVPLETEAEIQTGKGRTYKQGAAYLKPRNFTIAPEDQKRRLFYRNKSNIHCKIVQISRHAKHESLYRTVFGGTL